MDDPEYVEKARAYQRAYYLAHREKKIAYQRAYWETHKDEVNSTRRKPSDRWKNSKRDIIERDKARYNRRYHVEVSVEKNLRERVRALCRVSAGVPACIRCGELDIRVLVLNHRNGDGGAERKDGRKGRWITRAVAAGARRIDDLEVLCCNCNIRFEYDRGYRRLPRDWLFAVDDEVAAWQERSTP